MIIIEALLFLLVLLIAMAIPVMFILKAWMVDATLDAGVALGLLFGMFALTGFIWQTQGTVWMVLGIAALVGCCIGLPFLAGGSDRQELRRMRDEDIEKYQRAIAFDPRNASAHAFLAQKFVEYRRYDEAIAEYQQAIHYMPDGPNTAKWKSQLRDVLELQQGVTKHDFIVCHVCHADLPTGTKTCPRCGAILHMGFIEWFAQPENFKSIIRQTVITMLVFAVLWAIFSTLPLEVKGCVLCAAAIVGGFYFLRGIEGRRE